MGETLKVIKAFMYLVPGDTFVRDDDGNFTASRNDIYSRNDEDGDFDSQFSSTFTISPDYAKALVKEGILEGEKKTGSFRNVFDEINNLLDQYNDDMNNLDSDMKDSPECLKVEKATVLKNLIYTLNHLKNLKK